MTEEMSTRNHSGGRGRLARKADNLTAICEPIGQKMWEHRCLTTVWASTASYRDSFTDMAVGWTSSDRVSWRSVVLAVLDLGSLSQFWDSMRKLASVNEVLWMLYLSVWYLFKSWCFFRNQLSRGMDLGQKNTTRLTVNKRDSIFSPPRTRSMPL
jgi:hypothetical protein